MSIILTCHGHINIIRHNKLILIAMILLTLSIKYLKGNNNLSISTYAKVYCI